MIAEISLVSPRLLHAALTACHDTGSSVGIISFATPSKYPAMLTIGDPLAALTLIEKSFEVVPLIDVPFSVTPFHDISAETGNVLSRL